MCVIEYSARECVFRSRVHATFVFLLKLHVLGELLLFFVKILILGSGEVAKSSEKDVNCAPEQTYFS